MVLSAMDRHSKEVNDDQVGKRIRREARATLGLARARAALASVGEFESAELIRAERDGRSPQKHNDDGEVIPPWR
jgi:hypothetical protein